MFNLGEPMFKKKYSLAAMAAVGALALSACGGAGDTAADGEQPLEPLTMRNTVYFLGATLPFIAGIEEGIYEEYGIDLTVEEGTGSGTTIQTVANGSDDIGFADAGTLVQSRGAGVDATMIAGVMQQSQMAIFAFEDTGIEGPEDLDGRIAGYTPGSATELLFPAFAESTGVDEDSITFQNVDVPTRDQLFMSGETEFTFGATNTSQPNIEFRCDCEPTVIEYRDHGVNPLGTGIVAGPKIIEERPEVLEKFIEATVAAIEYTNANLDEAVEHFYTYVPDSHLEAEVVATQWEKPWRWPNTVRVQMNQLVVLSVMTGKKPLT